MRNFAKTEGKIVAEFCRVALPAFAMQKYSGKKLNGSKLKNGNVQKLLTFQSRAFLLCRVQMRRSKLTEFLISHRLVDLLIV